MSIQKPVRRIAVAAACCLFVLYACTKEETPTDGLAIYYQSVLGKWNVVYQGQFNSTDSTRDTIMGTDADFMEFNKNDSVYSNTILFGAADSTPFTLLNVQRFLIHADTVHNTSLTENVLNLYIRQPLTDTSYTQWWVDLKKAE